MAKSRNNVIIFSLSGLIGDLLISKQKEWEKTIRLSNGPNSNIICILKNHHHHPAPCPLRQNITNTAKPSPFFCHSERSEAISLYKAIPSYKL